MAYINKRRKEEVFAIAAFVDYLREKTDEWEEHDQSKEMIKYARMSASFGEKVIDDIFEALATNEREEIVKQLNKKKIIIKD
ncbi:hypothetical protein [Selenihalanaerobacter shriftii]|uniref:Uncharacterized protein n=1 Tax=Selenihalanaerobacter shriftii TaxID=142842 RepID=A0A1T4NW33_9FIRM|nr:hypothetical protein [Selenihalanaerobacter shriftii]SJZ83252.1 hypothetical protein SAMN02745118_01944 [Selenihalanaerobacter shriftii]